MPIIETIAPVLPKGRRGTMLSIGTDSSMCSWSVIPEDYFRSGKKYLFLGSERKELAGKSGMRFREGF
jgi:hypothetical protein